MIKLLCNSFVLLGSLPVFGIFSVSSRGVLLFDEVLKCMYCMCLLTKEGACELITHCLGFFVFKQSLV